MEVFPSIKELLPDVLLAKIPAKLADEMAVRYKTLGEKYLTDKMTSDGRRVNGMMYTDRITNCNEEIVDATFCIVGQIFKNRVNKVADQQELYMILDLLITTYSALAVIFDRGEYAK